MLYHRQVSMTHEQHLHEVVPAYRFPSRRPNHCLPYVTGLADSKQKQKSIATETYPAEQNYIHYFQKFNLLHLRHLVARSLFCNVLP
jgi:hypothetical protein